MEATEIKLYWTLSKKTHNIHSHEVFHLLNLHILKKCCVFIQHHQMQCDVKALYITEYSTAPCFLWPAKNIARNIATNILFCRKHISQYPCCKTTGHSEMTQRWHLNTRQLFWVSSLLEVNAPVSTLSKSLDLGKLVCFYHFFIWSNKGYHVSFLTSLIIDLLVLL